MTLAPLVLAVFLAILTFILGLLQRRGAGPTQRPSPVVVPRRRHFFAAFRELWSEK